MQDDRPLASYSRKLNSAQKRYTTGEQELLPNVETLKESKNILSGQKLIVHTDHKNLLYQKMSTDCIIQWRLLIEEFGPTFLHAKGEQNVIADALSQLDADFNETFPTEPSNDSMMAYIFLTEKDIKETDFPLSPILIAKYQRLDKQLKQKLISTTNQNFTTKTIEGVEVITYQGKICIPVQLQQCVVLAWYHEYLAHPGKSRTEATFQLKSLHHTGRSLAGAHIASVAGKTLLKRAWAGPSSVSFGHVQYIFHFLVTSRPLTTHH